MSEPIGSRFKYQVFIASPIWCYHGFALVAAESEEKAKSFEIPLSQKILCLTDMMSDVEGVIYNEIRYGNYQLYDNCS